VPDLCGKRFLDIGSGSGLFSLAARRMGATVHSFDYDAESVACTRYLRHCYFPGDNHWDVEQGDVLDVSYLRSLGQFDIVYAWGVLHHTGNLWQALGNIVPLVASGGMLYIAIYNDQGGASRRWRAIKRRYNRSGRPGKTATLLGIAVFWELRAALIRASRLQNPLPFDEWSQKKRNRGMSVWHDLVDWVGGYPFEVAKPEEVFDFLRVRGFTLRRITTSGGHGCNQYVLERASDPGD
jgi:SAM-dependent methyltransferase